MHFWQRKKQCPLNRQKVGVIAIMKNEALNIQEWVDHYKWQGVQRIFLIDNGSTDDSIGLVESEVTDGLVQLFYRPEPHKQIRHYRDIFTQAKIADQVEWLIMADIDEFWFSPYSTIYKALDCFADYDLIYTNWKVFGSSGFEHHPASLRKCLTLRHPQLAGHNETKWICRTDAIKDVKGIKNHKVSGIDSARVISDNNLFHLNHYILQSTEYFTKVKMTRGDVAKASLDSIRTMDYFESMNSFATQVDTLLADMLALNTGQE